MNEITTADDLRRRLCGCELKGELARDLWAAHRQAQTGLAALLARMLAPDLAAERGILERVLGLDQVPFLPSFDPKPELAEQLALADLPEGSPLMPEYADAIRETMQEAGVMLGADAPDDAEPELELDDAPAPEDDPPELVDGPEQGEDEPGAEPEGEVAESDGSARADLRVGRAAGAVGRGGAGERLAGARSGGARRRVPDLGDAPCDARHGRKRVGPLFGRPGRGWIAGLPPVCRGRDSPPDGVAHRLRSQARAGPAPG